MLCLIDDNCNIFLAQIFLLQILSKKLRKWNALIYANNCSRLRVGTQNKVQCRRLRDMVKGLPQDQWLAWDWHLQQLRLPNATFYLCHLLKFYYFLIVHQVSSNIPRLEVKNMWIQIASIECMRWLSEILDSNSIWNSSIAIWLLAMPVKIDMNIQQLII